MLWGREAALGSEGSEGTEGSKGGGGGCAANKKGGAAGAAGCVERLRRKRFLRLTGPSGRRVLRFDGSFGPEGCGIAYGATSWPGFRGFKRFCLPSAGGFKGWWYRPSGDEYMLWRSCTGPPSQPKLALRLPMKGPSFCRLTVFGGIHNPL